MRLRTQGVGTVATLRAEAGSVVVLERVDGAWPGVTATVIGEHDGLATVDLGIGLAEEMDADVDVVVSTVIAHSMWRQRAHAHKSGRFVELVLDGDAHRVARRQVPRRRINLPVCLVDLDGSDPAMATVCGNTVDIGPGGAHVWMPEAFPGGSDPTVWLTLPDGERVVVLATVLEVIDAGLGVEYRLVFRGIDDRAAAALSRLAAAAA